MKNPLRHRSYRLILATCLGLWLGLAARAQGLSYLLDINNPDINGLSTTEGFENQIEVQSYSFAGVNPITISPSSSEFVSGRFEFNSVDCVLALDGKAYPVLLTKLATGGQLGEVILSGVSFAGENRRVFFKLEMKDTRIESISQQGTNGDQPIVSVSFRPSSIRITTNHLNADGSESDPVVFTWNLLLNNSTY